MMTIGIGIEAGLLEQVNQKTDMIKASIDRMIETYQEQKSEAVMLDLSQAGTVITGGTVLIDLGGPPAGTYWVVRGIYLSDSALWTNTATATASQFGKGNIPPNVTQMPAVTVRRPFTGALPAFDTFGTNHFNLKYGDRLYAQAQGATVGQVLQATAYVEQWSVFARAIGPEGHS